jgi:hypothetical protein
MIRITLAALFTSVTCCFGANSALILDSTPGDWILNGQHRYYVPPEAVFTARVNQHNGMTVTVWAGDECWSLDFSAPNKAQLQVGAYDNAMKYGSEWGGFTTPIRPGLAVGGGICGDGHACNTLSGSFEVKQLAFGPGGNVESFHASFVQICSEFQPPLRGEIFYNSTDPLPPVHRILSPEVSYSTKGQFFRYQITSTEEALQYESSSLPPGLSLNATTGLISGIPTDVGTTAIELTVISAAGKLTRSWSLTTTPPYESTGPFTALRIFSEPGEVVGGGTSYFLTPDDGTFHAVAASGFGNAVPTTAEITFRPMAVFTATPGPIPPSSENWNVHCAAPNGQQLPGTYHGTGDFGDGARIRIQRRAAPSITGTFTVHQIATDGVHGLSRLKHFRGYYEQRSSNIPPLLRVWASFNAQNVVTSDLRVNARQGAPFEYQIIANNHPTGFVATGLPPGLSLDAATGLISGIPESEGEFTINLTVNGATANAEDTLQVHVRPARSLKNISTRAGIGTGDNVVIGGFIISGAQNKRVLIRGIGPTLRASGLNPVLEDPTLELRNSSGLLLIANDDWTSQRAEVESTGIPPAGATESAIVASLPPGAYTTILAGKNATTGIGLVEVYDLEGDADAMFGNISTRGRVGLGPDDAMIGGLIVAGGSGGASRIVVRGMGFPSGYGVAGELSDPTLALHDGNGNVLASNDNWADTQRDALIATTLAPTSSVHAAVFVDLPAGNYTAVIRGKGQDQGRALVEAYNLDSN